MSNSAIKKFFEDQTIFITGGTGFLGKVLIEKLLRTCDVRKIFVLVRPKNGKTVQERIDTFFSYPCFDRLKEEKVNVKHLVKFIYGNCENINLGISFENEELLINETNVVIHAAANVKFDRPLREAANINVRSTRDILELAKKMPMLKAFVYISTAFSNCPRSHIGEQFYDPPIDAKELMDFVDKTDDQVLEQLTPKFMGPWPNTYTMTKSVAEDLIKTEGKNLPVAIVRPAIVISTMAEPLPGWIDNFYGLIGITVGSGLGVIRSLHFKLDNIGTIIPCDYVSNIVLASAWNIAKEKQYTIPIYNYVGSRKNLLTWREYLQNIENCAWDYPTEKLVWYYTLKVRENILWHKICIFFQHTVVAYIADFILICLGRQPIAVKNYKRLDKLLDLTSYFGVRSWNFNTDNVEMLWEKMGDPDKKLFDFNMSKIDWKLFSRISVMGMRAYLLKEPLSTIPQGKKKLRILRVAHYSLKTIFYILLFSLFWWTFMLFV